MASPGKAVVLGGGVAGLAAAYYLARLGYPVTVFEATSAPSPSSAVTSNVQA